MEEVIGKTRDEILSGVSAEEVATLLNLIRKLEQNILDLQAKINLFRALSVQGPFYLRLCRASVSHLIPSAVPA